MHVKLLLLVQQAFPFFHFATSFCFTMPNTGETWSNNDDWHQAAGPQIVGHIDTSTKSNEAVFAELSKPVHADDGQSDAGESTSEMFFIPEKWGNGQSERVRNFANAERRQPYVKKDRGELCL